MQNNNAPSLSYWQQNRHLEPPAIRDPDQYDGSGALSIACTQTDLPASAQARLVQRWCELLPQLQGVTRLWFRSQVPQRLFDAATAVPGLTDLWIKWSSIKDIDSLHGASALRHLHLGGSAQIQSLAALASMQRLLWLTLENTKRISSLDFVAGLGTLQGFGYSGGIWGKPEVATLEPLAGLTALRWLDLSSLRVTDGSLRPLANLRQLQSLNLTNYHEMAEYAFLRAHLPNVAQDLEPYMSLAGLGIRCPKCKTEYLLRPTGRGIKNVCPACDATALARHCAAFDAACVRGAAAHQGSAPMNPIATISPITDSNHPKGDLS